MHKCLVQQQMHTMTDNDQIYHIFATKAGSVSSPRGHEQPNSFGHCPLLETLSQIVVDCLGYTQPRGSEAGLSSRHAPASSWNHKSPPSRWTWILSVAMIFTLSKYTRGRCQNDLDSVSDGIPCASCPIQHDMRWSQNYSVHLQWS